MVLSKVHCGDKKSNYPFSSETHLPLFLSLFFPHRHARSNDFLFNMYTVTNHSILQYPVYSYKRDNAFPISIS